MQLLSGTHCCVIGVYAQWRNAPYTLLSHAHPVRVTGILFCRSFFFLFFASPSDTISFDSSSLYFCVLAVRAATGIHSLEDLREGHILLVCRRPGEMSPGAAQLVNGLKVFSPGDEVGIVFE